MSKAELITWLAGLPEDAPELGRVDAIRRGEADGPSPDIEPFLTLTEVSKAVSKHMVWLTRLRVQEHCGVQIGGRKSYRMSRVLEYLASPACQERIAELREEKRRKRAQEGSVA